MLSIGSTWRRWWFGTKFEPSWTHGTRRFREPPASFMRSNARANQSSFV
jgi:hypothetical protein